MLDENLLPRLLELLNHSEIQIVENTIDLFHYMWRWRPKRIDVDLEKFGVFDIALNYTKNYGYRLTVSLSLESCKLIFM